MKFTTTTLGLAALSTAAAQFPDQYTEGEGWGLVTTVRARECRTKYGDLPVYPVPTIMAPSGPNRPAPVTFTTTPTLTQTTTATATITRVAARDAQPTTKITTRDKCKNFPVHYSIWDFVTTIYNRTIGCNKLPVAARAVAEESAAVLDGRNVDEEDDAGDEEPSWEYRERKKKHCRRGMNGDDEYWYRCYPTKVVCRTIGLIDVPRTMTASAVTTTATVTTTTAI